MLKHERRKMSNGNQFSPTFELQTLSSQVKQQKFEQLVFLHIKSLIAFAVVTKLENVDSMLISVPTTLIRKISSKNIISDYVEKQRSNFKPRACTYLQMVRQTHCIMYPSTI